MSIKTIIFSKNRAMQLDAVLNSYFLHCLDTSENNQVYVIYKADSTRYENQYRELSDEYPGVKFIRQKNFRFDLLSLFIPKPKNALVSLKYLFAFVIGGSSFRSGSKPDRLLGRCFDKPKYKLINFLITQIPSSNGILYLVDDNIFVEDFNLASMVHHLRKNSTSLGFSLRLGQNTNMSYSVNKPQTIPDFIPLAEGIVKYNWLDAEHDFGYPLEISSSLYLERVIVPLVVSVSFDNPNELEAAIASRTSFFRETHPYLSCYKKSVAFCNPINIVQSVFQNRAGSNLIYGIEELANRFDEDERIDVKAYSGFTPFGCHQEVPLIFKK